MHDGVHGRLHARRGARMIAMSNGGAIPDTALFNVILQPEGVQIATLDEHFAVDSSPGDVILLGNTSWRIQRIEAAGRVLVEDAHGAPPTRAVLVRRSAAADRYAVRWRRRVARGDFRAHAQRDAGIYLAGAAGGSVRDGVAHGGMRRVRVRARSN